MIQRANILQELNGIGSTALKLSSQNVYSVPDRYFEEFPDEMLDRIKSPLFNDKKQNPYAVPAGYFDGLEERLMQAVRESADYITAKEELETISPFLDQLKKETPYSVPQGYFEKLSTDINKPTTKVISITHRKWFRYAAAAIVVGFVATMGLMLNKNKSIDIEKNPNDWVAKNVKKVNTNQLDEFIKLADEENTTISIAAKNEKSEIKDLIKDVSDKEIQDFLTETSVLEDNSLLN